MAVHYRIQRTVVGLSKDSTLNGIPISMNDFLEFNPKSKTLEAKIVSKTSLDYYNIGRYMANDFAEILASFFKQPFDKERIEEGDLK